MKRITPIGLIMVILMLSSVLVQGQDRKNKTTEIIIQEEPKNANYLVFDHVSQYLNLKIDDKAHVLPDSLKPPVPTAENTVGGAFLENTDRMKGATSTECVTYYSGNQPGGYITNFSGLPVYPYIYSHGYYYYNDMWSPATITLSQPAVSVTINVWSDDYYYYGYSGARMTVYDTNGNYLGQVVNTHTYGWGEVTFTAPPGTRIGSYNIQAKYYSNTYWYLYYMTVCYES